MKMVMVVLLLLMFAVLAVMFDWFGSREIAQDGVEATQNAVERIQETGDAISNTIEQLNQNKGEQN